MSVAGRGRRVGPVRGGLARALPGGLLVSLLAGATPALAHDTATGALWELNLAAFGRHGPSYPASTDTQTDVVPLPFPVYRGRFLRLGEDTDSPLRGRVIRTDRVRLDIDFDLNFGADSDEIDARTGMPDLDLLVQLGPELEMQFVDRGWLAADAFLSLQLRAALSFDGLQPDYRGLVFSPELKLVRELGRPRQQLRLRITPSFATDEYMDYYYTVAPAFATPTRPAYAAASGYVGTDVSLSLRLPLTRRLELWGGVRQGLHGGARNDDSPLFTDRSTTAVYGAFMYRFWESRRRAVE